MNIGNQTAFDAADDRQASRSDFIEDVFEFSVVSGPQKFAATAIDLSANGPQGFLVQSVLQRLGNEAGFATVDEPQVPAVMFLPRGIHALVFTEVFTVVFLDETRGETIGDEKPVAHLVVGDGDWPRGFGIVKPGFVAFGQQNFAAVVDGRLADGERIEVWIARDLTGIDDILPGPRQLAVANFGKCDFDPKRFQGP